MNTKATKTENAKNFASLQEISKAFDFSYQTLNYYTSLGLIKCQKRQGNKRLYVISEVEERLEEIVKFKNKGYPLSVISSILNHKNGIKDELL